MGLNIHFLADIYNRGGKRDMKKIQHKILLSFIVVLLLLAGLGGVSYYNLHQTNENVETIIANDL